MQIGDSLKLLSFGKDFGDNPKFNNWIYNIPSSHDIANVSQVNVNTYRINILDFCVFYIDEILIIKNANGDQSSITVKQIEYASTNVEQIYSNTIVVQATGGIPVNANVITKTVTKASHNSNYFTEVSNFPVGIQNSYLDKEEKFFYVTSAGLPNYPIFATDNKVFVKTSTVEATGSDGILYIWPVQKSICLLLDARRRAGLWCASRSCSAASSTTSTPSSAADLHSKEIGWSG